MSIFVINRIQITALPAPPTELAEDAVVVTTVDDLDVERFPLDRLSALWNSLSTGKAFGRFKSHASAASKLWEAMANLSPAVEGPKRQSKQAQVIELLGRAEGATIEEITALTGWQPHSARGMIAGALKKKLGLAITSEAGPNGRVYRIAKAP